LVVAVFAFCGGSGPACADVFEHAAVAADQPVASQAGLAMLEAGGNAVDAAVAASFALSIVRPYSCGIGGGGFMVIRFNGDADHASKSFAIDFRETSPARVGADYYQSRDDLASTRGGSAVGVPGSVAGLLRALERFGSLDRATVLAPAIAAAEEGFVVDEHYAGGARELIGRFEARPAWKDRFSFVWDRFLGRGRIKAGDRIRLPEQARALRLIADRGAEAFYEGPIAQAIMRAIERDAGAMTSEDLARYAPVDATPIEFSWHEYTFIGMPPPSSGALAMAQILGIRDRILAHNPGTPAWNADPGGAHVLIEASKHAFADRATWPADPAFVDVPLDRLLSGAYLDRRAAMFDPGATRKPEAYLLGPGGDPIKDGGTSHLSVVDAAGNAVACTQTINLAFGSLLAVPEFGFVLNNEMDDFTTHPGRPNAFGLRQSDRNLPAPGKRPLSSMSPTIVLGPDGRVAAVAGASGGPRIISATLESLLLGLGSDKPDPAAWALDQPRLHHQWLPNAVLVEPGFFEREGFVEGLNKRGHEVRRVDSIAAVQLIVRTEAGWSAASDPRKGGRPAGD